MPMIVADHLQQSQLLSVFHRKSVKSEELEIIRGGQIIRPRRRTKVVPPKILKTRPLPFRFLIMFFA